MELDVERSRDAIERDRQTACYSVEDAAYGILRIVNENMLGALRLSVSSEGSIRATWLSCPLAGLDRFTARSWQGWPGSVRFWFHRPQACSRRGFLLADITDVSLTHIGVIGTLDEAVYNREIAGLIEQADEWLDRGTRRSG
ncbi:MAG: hypothetical protein R2849_13450 [Thermomicrobiales bacterium]